MHHQAVHILAEDDAHPIVFYISPAHQPIDQSCISMSEYATVLFLLHQHILSAFASW